MLVEVRKRLGRLSFPLSMSYKDRGPIVAHSNITLSLIKLYLGNNGAPSR